MRSPTTALANWNGQEMLLSEVKVPALDRAFLLGDAVYEVIRVYGGRLFCLEDHFDRLKKSLSAMRIVEVDLDEVNRRLCATLEHSQVEDGLAYVQITRGEALRAHVYPTDALPNVLIYVEHFFDPYKDVRAKGVKAVTHPDIRWARNDIKATSLAANCMAAEYARQHGCAEVILIDKDGFVTEGSHTTIFGVEDGSILVTPASANVLPGITKKIVLELARASGIPIVERRIREEEIFSLEEMFLSATPEEVIAIVNVNGEQLGMGSEGPIVRRLRLEFKELLQRWLAGEAGVAR